MSPDRLLHSGRLNNNNNNNSNKLKYTATYESWSESTGLFTSLVPYVTPRRRFTERVWICSFLVLNSRDIIAAFHSDAIIASKQWRIFYFTGSNAMLRKVRFHDSIGLYLKELSCISTPSHARHFCIIVD
jgi:hypothetical protein